MPKHLFLLSFPPVSYTSVFLGFVKCQERREDGKVTTTLLVDGGPLEGTLQRFYEDKAQRVTDSVSQIIGNLMTSRNNDGKFEVLLDMYLIHKLLYRALQSKIIQFCD